MIALLEHRFLGDLPVGRIAQPRHQLVVLFLGAVLFLLEPVQDDVRIADSLEPGQPALDFLADRAFARWPRAMRSAQRAAWLSSCSASRSRMSRRFGSRSRSARCR